MKILLLIFASTLLLSCAASVHFSSLTAPRTPKAADHFIFVFTPKDSLPPKAIVLGEISVTDAGLAVNCGLEEVVNKAKVRAREVGADAIQIVSVIPPSFFGSSCYQIKALAIGLDSVGSHEEASGPTNLGFLSFSDAFPCIEQGYSPDTLRKATVYLIPFGARTVYDDGKIENVGYPATKVKINQYFDSLLAATGRKVIDTRHKDFPADSLFKFYSAVVQRATLGKESPLEWGGTLTHGVVDSAAVVFIPLGIERESQHEVTPRFYFLLANSNGKIVLSRCLEYDAGKWSSDFGTFVKDTRTHIPLAN